MNQKFILLKILTNTKGQDGSSIAKYDDPDSAIVGYHQTLANYRNADDVLYACVEILTEAGTRYMNYNEIIDRRPVPEV